MVSFSMLPNELIAHVAGYLDSCSLNAFRVTSKHINEVIVYTETDKEIYSKDIATCVKHGKIEFIKRYLDAHPYEQININYMVDSARAGKMDTFMILFDHFCALEAKNPTDGQNVFLTTITECLNCTWSIKTKMFIIKAFVDKRIIDIDDIRRHGLPIFIDVVDYGQPDYVKTLFDIRAANMEWIDRNIHSLYQKFAQSDNAEMVRVFISNRIVFENAVYHAIQFNAYKMLDVLLESGYEVTDDVFINALLKNNNELTRKLIAHGANVNAQNGYVLRLACDVGFSTVHLLLDNGADPALRDSLALCVLCMNMYNDEESFEVASLIHRMIQLGADVNAKDGAALQSAYTFRNRVLVRVLLECGAEVGRYTGVLNSHDIECMLCIVSHVDQEAGCIDKDKRILALREAFGEITY